MDEVKYGRHNGHNVSAPSFSLRDLLSVVFRRKRLMLLSFVGLLLGAVLAMVILPSTYEGQMKILVERERVDPVVSTQGNVIEADRNLTPDEISSEVELFQSRDSLKQTVVDCGLYEVKNRWSLAAIKMRALGAVGLAPDKDQRIFKALLALEKDLHVIPMNNSNLIKVMYEAHSPQAAEQILTELGNLYLVKHAAVHRPQGTSEFFQQQADQYKNDLANAESRLVKMNQQTGIVSADFEKQSANTGCYSGDKAASPSSARKRGIYSLSSYHPDPNRRQSPAHGEPENYSAEPGNQAHGIARGIRPELSAGSGGRNADYSGCCRDRRCQGGGSSRGDDRSESDSRVGQNGDGQSRG